MDTSLMFSEELEASVLASIFVENDLMLEISDKELFYVSCNQLLFTLMKDMYNKYGVIDEVTICNEIVKKKMTDKITPYYVAKVKESECNTSAFNVNVKELNDYLTKRRIKKAVSTIDFTKDAETLKSEYINSVDAVTKEETKEISNAEYIEDYINRYYSKRMVVGIPSGLKSLDDRIICLENGALIGIVALQGLGKTTLATSMFTKMVMQGISASFVTIEMTKDQIMQKIIPCGARVDFNRFRNQKLTSEEETEFIKFMGLFGGMNYSIHEDIFYIEDICTRLKKDKLKNNIQIAFVDLLNRIESREYDSNNRALYISKITARLKRLAKELDIPIILTAQLKRDVEKQTDKRPTLADVKESGGLGEDADYILGFYRNRMFDDEKFVSLLESKGKIDRTAKDPDVNPDRCEVSILKGRFSGTARMSMKSMPQFQDVREI